MSKKVTLELIKNIYGNEAYDFVDKDFTETFKSTNVVDVKTFFMIYKDMFYDIPMPKMGI